MATDLTDPRAACIRGPDRDWWWWWENIGEVHLSADTRFVEINVLEGIDRGALSRLIMGALTAFILNRRGCLTLHGSAVGWSSGVVGFLGRPGAGKSSIAAMLTCDGAHYLADDLFGLAITEHGIAGLPGWGAMKLWPDAVEGVLAADPSSYAKVERTLSKRLVSRECDVSLESIGQPLLGLYLLDRYEPEVEGHDDVVIETLAMGEALAAILTSISPGASLDPEEMSRIIPAAQQLVAQTPVHLLRYPNGWGYQKVLTRAIVGGLASP
jgi:hypothetical protein